MKRMLLLLICLPFLSNAQVRVTTGPGDFLNPLIWNPIGIPTDGDSLEIDHAVNMNTDIYYTHGQIKINASGSLTEGPVDRSVWINGGSLVNHGTYESNILVVSAFGYIDNSGTMLGIDSMLNQATITNTGTITVYDYAVDHMGTHTNIGDLFITNNFHSQGVVTNVGNITVAHDFSNCNTQIGHALFVNDGLFCIDNDFLNCADDTITGFGNYFVGNLASNLGTFHGTHTFHTPSGTLVIPGNVYPGVTITTGACNLSASSDILEYELYPNPTTGDIHVTALMSDYSLLDNRGAVVLEGSMEQGTISLGTLEPGIYFLHVPNAEVKRIIKH